MKLRWTKLALNDLTHAFAYLADKNPSIPAVLLPRIEKSLEALRSHPHIGRAGRVPGTRELIITGTPFVVPYRIKIQSIELVAFIHSSRRWPDAF